MALNINGTTGISGVDGSASAPALQGTDSNTGINFASDTVNINTGGTTRATVDSSGNLNIPDGGKIQLGASQDLKIYHDSGGNSFIEESGSGHLVTNAEDYYIQNAGGSSTHVLVDSAGKVQIATLTALAQLTVAATWPVAPISCDTTSSNASAAQINFRFNNSAVGSISSTSSSTAFNTSSDYRLKENVVGISDGITRLKTLKPSRFNFKVDKDTTVDGFLAHEVTPVVPEAITGTKDEVDENNEPVYQGIDQSKLVPLLTAALQEAIAKIEILETKVAALEAG